MGGPEAGAAADDPALAATFVDVSRAAPPVTAKAEVSAPLPSSRAAGKPGAVGRPANSGAD
jgi:hypothetical protein